MSRFVARSARIPNDFTPLRRNTPDTRLKSVKGNRLSLRRNSLKQVPICSMSLLPNHLGFWHKEPDKGGNAKIDCNQA